MRRTGVVYYSYGYEYVVLLIVHQPLYEWYLARIYRYWLRIRTKQFVAVRLQKEIRLAN